MSAAPERRRINGAEQVRDESGLWRTIRTWNPAANDGRGGHRFSRYAQRVGVPSVRYIVEVPVTAHFKRSDGRVQSYTHQQDGARWTVPVDEHAIGDVSMPADLAVVRDVGHHNRQKAFIREAIVRYLRSQPRDEKGDIVLLAFEQSDAWFTLDEEGLNDLDGFTFSSEVEYHLRDRPPFVETILNRPLRHFANLPLEFLFKLDLIPQATQDLGGRCVQTQLVYCVRRRSQPGGDQQSAERVWARDEDLEPLLDAIEDALYPGRYEGAPPPPAEPEPNPERERHRESLRAFLPAWRRDRVPGQRQSWIFQPGVPRDYDDLRRTYVSNTVLTRLPQFQHLGSFAEALRANSPRDMPLHELLWYFFELFPCHFRCYRRSGKVLGNWQHNAAHSNAVLTQVKPEPYSRAGWRTVGITSHMVIEVGKRLGVPVYILHNDSKLYQWLPETKDPHRSAIVFNVWGDHAFLYAPGSRAIGSAAKLKVHARADLPRVRLATRRDDSERARLEQMRPFDAEEFLRYTEWLRKNRGRRVEPSPMQHWSGVWRTTRIEEACGELAALGLSLHRVLGTKPSSLVELAHKESGRVARVKQMHAQFETLAALAARLADGIKLKEFYYYGESPQALLDRFCCAALAERRQRLDRAAVFARQGDACDKCGLRDYLEVHHRKPVSQGGDSSPENLVGLCRYCHREETDSAASQGMRHYRAYYSQFSPRVANLFMRDVRMPRAWVHGDGAEDPFGENEEEELLCLDIRGCRRNAIFTTERLPVFGPADEEREFNPLVPNLHADFFWVEEGDESEMLYQGPNLYHREAVQYMLELGIVRLDGIRFALAASRHVPGQHFREVYQTLEAAVAQLGADKSLPKDSFNAMFGLWNRPIKVSLAARRSGCVDDLHRVDVISSRLGSDEAVADCIVRTRVIGVESAYPLGLVALQKELVAVHRMRRGLLGAGVDIRGVRTDGIFFRRRGADLSSVLGHRYPNGEPMYSLKELPRDDEGQQRLHLVPRCPQKALAPQTRPLPPKPKMRVLEERDVPTAFYESYCMPFPDHVTKTILEYAGVPTDWGAQNAHLVVENQGALVTGMPGTGKSLLISRIVERWRAARPDDRIVVMAPTHVAARLLEDGETMQRVFFRMKHNRVRDTLFVVDEVGMATLSAIGRIAEWQLLGAKFVLLGDFQGQLLPIQDPWERMHMESADVYRQLARSLHLHLSENRRAAQDPEHWWFLKTLYQFVWEPERLPEDVWAATQRYPWDGHLSADMRVLAVSHYLRTRVNRIMNERFVKPLMGSLLVRARFEFKDTLNQPQDMWLLPRMVLQGCSQSNSLILNGVLYEVTAIGYGGNAALFVQVRMLPRYRKRGEGDDQLITLCELDASRMLRLTHCTTYRSAQGSTIASGPVLLLDGSHKYLDHRMLIVGLSRVASGAQLRVATRAQQEEAFGWAGQGREEFAPHRELRCRLDDRASTDGEATERARESASESASESESEAQERAEESDPESDDE